MAVSSSTMTMGMNASFTSPAMSMSSTGSVSSLPSSKRAPGQQRHLSCLERSTSRIPSTSLVSFSIRIWILFSAVYYYCIFILRIGILVQRRQSRDMLSPLQIKFWSRASLKPIFLRKLRGIRKSAANFPIAN
jgi:hypothetical protein